MKIFKSLSAKYLFTHAGRSFSRFPGVMICAYLATIISIYLVELKGEPEGQRLVGSILLGLPLFLATTLWRESKNLTDQKWRVLELLIGTALLTAHYAITAQDESGNYYLKYIQISLALHLAVSFVCCMGIDRENRFWQLNKNIFLRVLSSILFSSVLYIGLVIALVTTTQLFDFKFPGQVSVELWLVAAITFQTWHFVAGLPADLRNLDDDHSYPRGLRVFVQYLLIPLVSLYTLILYCYMIKILITRTWPNGYVSWLVSVMSVLGILNLLLIDPEKEKSESRWIRAYAKAYYILVLPLLAMLFGAVGKRISMYGVTEQRYGLVVLGCYLGAMATYFIFSKRKSIKVIPITLCAVAVATLWGPWGMYSISKNSQIDRATRILHRNGMIEKGQVRKRETPVSEADRTQLASILVYLTTYHGVSSIAHLFPAVALAEVEGHANTKRDYSSASASALLRYLDLERDVHGQAQAAITSFILKDSSYLFEISGFSQMFVVDSEVLYGDVKIAGTVYKLSLDQGTNELSLHENRNLILKIPLNDHLSKLQIKFSKQGYPEKEDMTFDGVFSDRKFRIVYEAIGSQITEGKNRLNSLRLRIFL